MWKFLIVFAAGYFIGSINFSIIITRIVGGYDIRERGSGNAGGTNVSRNLGSGWGLLVIVCEILKSSGLGLFAKYVFPADIGLFGEMGATVAGLVAVFGCILGNTFPCYYGFKGGKGVTVGAASAAVVDFRVFIILLVLFIIVLIITKYVSLSSMIAGLCIPIGSCIVNWGKPWAWLVFSLSALVTAIIIFNHRSNIKRLLSGTENKFSLTKKGK